MFICQVVTDILSVAASLAPSRRGVHLATGLRFESSVELRCRLDRPLALVHAESAHDFGFPLAVGAMDAGLTMAVHCGSIEMAGADPPDAVAVHGVVVDEMYHDA